MLRLITLSLKSRCSNVLQSEMTKKLATTAAVMPTSKEPINLLAGWPNPRLLPPQTLKTAAEHVCNDESISTPALSYGDDEGYHPLREAIASWLTTFYQRRPAATLDQICITGGASQNLSCVLQAYSDPVYTRNIWLVSPTYFHACKIFDDAGFAGRLKAVPEDAEGIDLDYLERAIHANEEKALNEGNTEPKFKRPRPWRKIFKHIIYAVPTFANPSGRLMSLARREGLVRIARQYDALVVTDDVYDMLQWPVNLATTDPPHKSTQKNSLDRASLPRLVDIDATLDGGPVTEFGNTVSNGTFSKIVAPGCRTGWAQGTPKMAWGISQTGATQSGGAPSQFTSTFIHQLITTGWLQKHINETLQPSYSRRYHSMLAAIRMYLVPLGCKLISEPAKSPTMSDSTIGLGGGYFHYLTLPSSLTTSTNLRRAHTQNGDRSITIAERIKNLALEQENLMVMAGPLFRVEGDPSELENRRYEADIRLSFAWADEQDIAEGVKRLANVIERELQLQSASSP